MDHRRRTSLFLFAALAVSVRAGAEQLPLKIYTTAEGLGSNGIHCILADSSGFLWFGTEDGISRFDGYGFTNLSRRDGLPGTDVYALLEASDGTYWAGTTAGLFHWDPARKASGRGVLRQVIHLGAGQAADDVRSLVEESPDVIWAGTRAGLYGLEKNLGSWRVAAEAAETRQFSGSRIYALLKSRDGRLWIAAATGLYWRSAGRAAERIVNSEGLPRDVRCLFEDRAGNLWAGQYRGIVKITFDKSGDPTVWRVFPGEASLAGSHVTGLFESSDGTLWATCFGGLVEISPDRSSVRSHTTAQGVAATGVGGLAEDRNGNLWVGSDSGGAMRLARGGFRRYDGRDGLASTRIGSLFEDREGRPCAFTRGTLPEQIAADVSFLECFDGRRFRSVRPRLLPGVSFGWGVNQVAFQDSRGEWWVPTATGLYRFPAVPFERLGEAAARRIYTIRDGLPSDLLFRLFEDSRGNLWVSVLNGPSGLALWVRESDSFRVFSAADGIPSGDEPASFAEDRSGSVWIGFTSGGLARYRDRKFTLYREKDGLPRGGLLALHVDRAGRLWVASDSGGVARIDAPEAEAVRSVRYGVREGLSSDETFSLAEDGWGRIYVGTARGLDRLDPGSGLLQHFTPDDGLALGNIETSLPDRRGDLWFGSTQGLSRLRPGVAVRRSPPPVLITQVIADGARQPLPDLGVRDARLPKLGPGPAPVQIDFLAIDFAPGGRPRYQYVLEGVDRGWNAATDQRSVVYGRLPPGDYRFRVRSIANDGSVGQASAEVQFTILAPFWRRPEALALAVAVLGGLAYLFHRYRLKSALAIERVRTRVATDLHDDIGSDLSEIAILTELARKDGQPESRRILAEIGERARGLVDSMSDIVWSTDPHKDDLASLVQRIRRFAANTLESRGIGWSLESEESLEALPLDPERRRQVLMIVKEALTNVARHADCAHASVRLFRSDGVVTIEIEDDGKGFELSAGAGHGLENMRSRAASQGGTLEVDSRPSGGGTRVTARVPLRRGG